MLHLLVVTLAVFWVWEFVKYGLENFAPFVFDKTRVAHPLLVLGVAFWQTYPDYLSAAAIAAVVGILHILVEKIGGVGGYAPVTIPRPRRGGLPPLP